MTVEEWIAQLHKFEVVMLTPIQIQEFNLAFESKGFDHDSALFKSWLPLKLATIPTEAESIKKILASHTFSNVPKRKNVRQDNLPTGKDRFDPTCQAWIDTLKSQEEKKRKTLAKKKNTQTKKSVNKNRSVKK